MKKKAVKKVGGGTVGTPKTKAKKVIKSSAKVGGGTVGTPKKS